MTTKPRIAIVIGSTRPGRYADKAAGWMLKQTQARDDIEAELLDLRDHPLPFFDEKGPLISTPSENAEALRWQKTLARYDGFVFVVAEIQQLNHGCAEERARPSLQGMGTEAVHGNRLRGDRSVAGSRAPSPHRDRVGHGLDREDRQYWRRRFHVDLPDGWSRACTCRKVA
jgi:hypothetical protein